MADDTSHLGGYSHDDKLRMAASKGQVERIPTLLAQGAGFEPDKEGRTAIHYAALSGYSEAVRILAVNGCDANTKDNLGYTCLHRASAQGHLEVVRVLCDCGCNLNVQDDVHGNTALHEAAWNGYSRTVALLCQYKASVHLVNKVGFSALHLAAQNGHNQTARTLLYANCDANCKNNYGDTPLHTAGRYGHAGVTRILLSAKCRLSEQNKNGDTPLHIATALKRRKIAKLLVESNINVNIKNKQNETAADVSRRKEFPEILLIISSQSKLHKQKKKEDKKKKKEGKVSGIEESDDPRKDKKMFFFRKRSKSKDKENKENREASVDRLDSRAVSAPSSMEGHAGAGGSDLHSHSSGGDANRPLKSRTVSKERLAKSQGTSTRVSSEDRHQSKVHGLLTQYEAKKGVQYYRDLAGNIKQGPIGFTPVCNCGPSLKKIEQRIEADKSNIYDHIDSSHKMLTHKMEDMDHKCSHRVQSSDRMHQQHLEDNQRLQQNYVHSKILHERQQTDQAMRFQEHLMRSEYMDYVGRKMGTFEDHYAPLPSRCKGCDHCGQNNQCGRHRDDSDIHRASMPYSVYQQGTGLYRSKSDETLSISSSHPSKRHWKSKARSVRELKDKYLRKGIPEGYQAPDVREKYPTNEVERNFFKTRPTPQGQGGGNVPQSQGVYRYDGREVSKQVSSGRSPEGQSSNNDYSEESPYLDPVSHYGTWGRKRTPLTADTDTTMHKDFEKLTVRDYPQSSLSNGQHQATSTPLNSVGELQRPHSGPNLLSATTSSQLPQKQVSAITNNNDSAQSTPDHVHNAAYNAPFNTPEYSSPSYNTTNSSYNTGHNNSSRLTTTSASSFVLSPDQVQIHHTKTDSGSNPDSGYSSKYGMRPMVPGGSFNANPDTANNNVYPQQSTQSQRVGSSQYPGNLMHQPPPQQVAHYQQPQQQRSQFAAPTYQQRYNTTNPVKTVHKNRGYSSDGCPGMRRPKPDAYASDNCSGMRMKKQTTYQKSGLNDWYEKQVSGRGNGVIREVPVSQQQEVNGHWPGKATQV